MKQQQIFFKYLTHIKNEINQKENKEDDSLRRMTMKTTLKGQCHEIFTPIFGGTNLSVLLNNGLKYFRFSLVFFYFKLEYTVLTPRFLRHKRKKQFSDILFNMH